MSFQMQADTASRLLAEHSRRASEDVFPPQTSRIAEIDALVEMLRGVGLASATGTVTVALVALGASWAFMLQQWYASNLPQENVILTRGYAAAGLALALWTASWLLVGAWSLLLLAPFACGALYALGSLRTFKATG